jgi:flavin-dependent dehydrogenase
VDFTTGPGQVIIQAEHEDGSRPTWQARFVIDATGRDTLLGNQFKAKQRNPKHNSAALYAHFSGAVRHPGSWEGNISIFWFEHGWFWFIPLKDGITSIGAVAWPDYMKTRGKRSPEQFLLETIQQCPALQQRMQQARLVSPVEATGNFAYACDFTHGANYLLLGDAYAFIDPVFSSGVMLAMNSAFAAADAVECCLREPACSVAALQRFDQILRHGPKEFSWFIYRVSSPSMRDLFMGPKNYFRSKEALLSVLAGDIFGDTPIWRSVRIFKAIYYLHSLLHLKRSFLAWKNKGMRLRASATNAAE